MLNDWEEDRKIMQNGGDGQQEEIKNQLPAIPEDSAIPVKGNLDMQDQDLVHDQPETSNGQEMVEMRKRSFGNLQSGDLGVPNEGGAETAEILPIRRC